MKKASPAAIGIVFNPERTQVLLVKRCDVAIWTLPGGGIDLGESPETAACREVFEETGYSVQAIRKVADYYPVNRLAQATHVYECEIKGGEPTLNAESQGVAFYPLNQLPKDGFRIHYLWIEDALKNRAEVIVGPVPGVTYGNLLKYCLSHPIWVLRMLMLKFL